MKPAGHRCGFIEYADRVLAEKEGPKMRESVMWAIVVPDRGAMDAKFTVEQGYAIMLGKPIIAMALPGACAERTTQSGTNAGG